MVAKGKYMSKKSISISQPTNSFAGLPVCRQLKHLEADIAIIGLHYVSPYPTILKATATNAESESAPDAIRRQSSIFVDHLDHYDFNFNDVLLANRQVRIVDCGDVNKPVKGELQNPQNITNTIRTILSRGAIPFAIGTDEGGFIPLARAYDDHDSLCVVHIDAHIDWRDERHGIKDGYSSVMRRVSEMPWIKSMVQIGMRGIGSARKQEIDDALSFGSVFIRAREIHRKGINDCIQMIPEANNYLITIDSDALDIAIAPGVLFPSPGGLTFEEITDLVQQISLKGQIAGLSLFEIRPELDVNGLTASTAAQMIVNFIGTIVRSGQM
jgi:agmatinase